jgi:hypothetical protein
LFTPADLRTLADNPCCLHLAQWRTAARSNLFRTRQAASRAGLTVVELPMLFSPALGRHELEELSRTLGVGLNRSQNA